MIDRGGYQAVRASASAVFNLGFRFPDQVFRSLAGSSLFCEFEAVLGASFWPALSSLAQLHGDDRVELLVLTPDADSYYVPEYGMYPAASIATTCTGSDYWQTVSEEPSGDVTGAIVFSAEVVAFVGFSGMWGCWGERRLGVAVIRGVPAGELDGWRESHGPFLEASEALSQYIAPNFGGMAVPDEIASAIVANYQSPYA